MTFRALRPANMRVARAVRVPTTIRGLAYTAATRFPYKDDQDRNDLKPRSTEGTKTGTDSEAAQSSEAFDASKTRPESERAANGPELEVSGANQEVSKPQGDKPDGRTPGKETRKGGRSGGGSSPKAGNV
ncbi:hypothetical protein C8034_v001431 [Colletotrichum sidae]|uniref:Uncharacterized protein n=1 Tax=Colletotrichum sidae TaxID=1347389 RepID=A0A4R8TDW8_9PEZI|nr:hypothetical protein C8034_v001431 [Colletotrichum sidae]